MADDLQAPPRSALKPDAFHASLAAVSTVLSPPRRASIREDEGSFSSRSGISIRARAASGKCMQPHDSSGAYTRGDTIDSTLPCDIRVCLAMALDTTVPAHLPQTTVSNKIELERAFCQPCAVDCDSGISWPPPQLDELMIDTGSRLLHFTWFCTTQNGRTWTTRSAYGDIPVQLAWSKH